MFDKKQEKAKDMQKEEKKHGKECTSLERKISDLQAQNDEYKDRLLRLQADFDNAKKRMQRQQQDFIKFANEGLLVDLLSILDDLERSVEAIETKHQDPQAFLKGIEMILSHLYELLKKNEVRAIDGTDTLFDPNVHEALMQVEDDSKLENTIVEVMQKGYMMYDRVIRTAKVKVAKPKDRSQATEDKEQEQEEDRNKAV